MSQVRLRMAIAVWVTSFLIFSGAPIPTDAGRLNDLDRAIIEAGRHYPIAGSVIAVVLGYLMFQLVSQMHERSVHEGSVVEWVFFVTWFANSGFAAGLGCHQVFQLAVHHKCDMLIIEIATFSAVFSQLGMYFVFWLEGFRTNARGPSD